MLYGRNFEVSVNYATQLGTGTYLDVSNFTFIIDYPNQKISYTKTDYFTQTD
jgi:hypothetical protein